MKTTIITGAGKGIGKSIALTFAKEKHNLVLAARNESELNKVADECRKSGAKVLICPTDITSETKVINLIIFTKENFSKIDILINNAGIGVFKHLIDTTIDEWKEVIDINLTGTFLCSREAMKIMINQKMASLLI